MGETKRKRERGLAVDKQEARGPAPADSPFLPDADPPRPNVPALLVVTVLLVLWIGFLIGVVLWL